MCWIPATPERCCRRRAAPVAGIDFSALIIATDFDGDATAGAVAGSFVVTIENDVPVANEGPRCRSPFDSGGGRAVDDALGDPGDLSDGNLDAGQDNLLPTRRRAAAGSLDALFNVGADEPLTYALVARHVGPAGLALAGRGGHYTSPTARR